VKVQHYEPRQPQLKPQSNSSPLLSQPDQSSTMAVSTSTITTSRSNKDAKAPRLRVEPETVASLPPLGVKEHDFFWTYTEEPHRTRRMAIIKAHPEVCAPSIFSKSPIDNSLSRSRNSAGQSPSLNTSSSLSWASKSWPHGQ
jgi:hypothetical protein